MQSLPRNITGLFLIANNLCVGTIGYIPIQQSISSMEMASHCLVRFLY
nr:MAG TPA: hypothetical protein [Bacteriophage sp.]